MDDYRAARVEQQLSARLAHAAWELSGGCLKYGGDLTPSRIWNIRQNRPTLVVRDLEAWAPPAVIYAVLLGRGVFKWLAVRRDMIRLKDSWKEKITSTIGAIRQAKKTGDTSQHVYLKGYLKGYEECRGQIRALCHSERWRCPDNDRDAQRWLEQMEVGI